MTSLRSASPTLSGRSSGHSGGGVAAIYQPQRSTPTMLSPPGHSSASTILYRRHASPSAAAVAVPVVSQRPLPSEVSMSSQFGGARSPIVMTTRVPSPSHRYGAAQEIAERVFPRSSSSTTTFSSPAGIQQQHQRYDPTILLPVSNMLSGVAVSQLHRPPSWATIHAASFSQDTEEGGHRGQLNATGAHVSRVLHTGVAGSGARSASTTFESSIHSTRLASREARPQIASSTGGDGGKGGAALRRRSSAVGEAVSPSPVTVNSSIHIHNSGGALAKRVSSPSSSALIMGAGGFPGGESSSNRRSSSSVVHQRLEPNLSHSNSWVAMPTPAPSGDLSGKQHQQAQHTTTRRSSSAMPLSAPGPAGGASMQAADAVRYRGLEDDEAEDDEDAIVQDLSNVGAATGDSTLDSFQWPPHNASGTVTPISLIAAASTVVEASHNDADRHSFSVLSSAIVTTNTNVTSISTRSDTAAADLVTSRTGTLTAERVPASARTSAEAQHSPQQHKKSKFTVTLLDQKYNRAGGDISTQQTPKKPQPDEAAAVRLRQSHSEPHVGNLDEGSSVLQASLQSDRHRHLQVLATHPRPTTHQRTQSEDTSWIERMLHDHPSIAAESVSHQHGASTTNHSDHHQRAGLATLSFRQPTVTQSAANESDSLHDFLVDASNIRHIVAEEGIGEQATEDSRQHIPKLVVTSESFATTHGSDNDADDNGRSPMHERPLSILLRRKSAPLPRRESHHTPDAHLDVVEHPESFSTSPRSASASNSPNQNGHHTFGTRALHVISDDDTNNKRKLEEKMSAYFPASPEVENEYPAALMLWRRRASEMNLLTPSSNNTEHHHHHPHGAAGAVGSGSDILPSPASTRRSPPRRESTNVYNINAERPLYHGGSAHPARSRNDDYLTDEERYWTGQHVAVSPIPRSRHTTTFTADASSSSSSALLPRELVSEYLDTWVAGNRQEAAAPFHRTSSPAVAHPQQKQSDAELLRDHKHVMDELRQGHHGDYQNRNTSHKLDQQLQSRRQEGQYRRGRLAAMNYATEARLAAVRRVALEMESTKILSQESSCRADVSAEWQLQIERLYKEWRTSWMIRRQADLDEKERIDRASCHRAESTALDDLQSQYWEETILAERRAHVRWSLETLLQSWEPTARHDVVLQEEQERSIAFRVQYDGYCIVVQWELLRTEANIRNMMDLFRDDELQQIFVDETAGIAAAKHREAVRIANEVFFQDASTLSRTENEARLQIESEERKEARGCCAWLDKQTASLRDRLAVDEDALNARNNIEENEANMWNHLMCFELVRSVHVARQRELIRICFERRGMYLRQEDEERHELVMAERKGKWEAEDALRRRMEMEMSTMRHGHRQARDAFESHASHLVEMVRIEETDERENILQVFEVMLSELHERERSDSHRRFLAHQAEQRDALASLESDFRLEVNEAENAARYAQLQRQYRQELVISRLFETERTMRHALADQQIVSFAQDITSEMILSAADALERQRQRELREADAAKLAALRVRATNSAPFLGFSLAEKIASSSADKRLVSAAGIATLVVDSLVVGGPAFTSGVRLHDRIVTVKGAQPTSLIAVRQVIAKGASPGDLFEIVVKRQRRRSTASVDVELDEEGLTARSLAEVDFGAYMDDDGMSETSSSSQQNSPGRSGILPGSPGGNGGVGSTTTSERQYETLTFYIPVKTVNAEFTELHDLFFDLTDTQRIERNAPTPGYVTRSKKNFAEKLNSSSGVRPGSGDGHTPLSSRPRAATVSVRMSSPAIAGANSSGSGTTFASPLLRPAAGTIITAPITLHSTSVSPADPGYTPSPDLTRHATSLPRAE